MKSAASPSPNRTSNLGNMPSPVPMIWQLTVPSNISATEYEQFEPFEDSDSYQSDESSDSVIEPQYLHNIEMFDQAHSTNINIINKPVIPSTNNINTNDTNNHIINILTQFGQFTNYHIYSTYVVSGYIRNLQNEVTSIIPTDINTMTLSFYYDIKNKYIPLTYKLYKIMQQSSTNEFSGKALVSMIRNNDLNQNYTENISEICNNLIQYKCIELVSYQTKFFSLFDKTDKKNENLSFNASGHYIYKITDDNFKAFHNYSSTSTRIETHSTFSTTC